MSPEQRRQEIQYEPAFKLLGLVELLAEEARTDVRHDQGRALEVAELAVLGASAVDPAGYARGQVADARAAAWAALANVLRVRADLSSAERALGVARRQLALGGGDLLGQADVLNLTGSLSLDQGLYAKARRALEQAATIFREVADRPGQGKALIRLAEVAGETDEPETAVGLLESAERLFDSPADRRLLLIARHARAWRLVEAGRAWEATALVRSFRKRYLRELSASSEARRLPWLVGRIHQRTGQLDQAANLLDQVRRGFEADGNRYDLVISTLDLGEVRLQQGLTREVRRLTEGVLPLINTHNLPTEATKAWKLLQKAV